MKKECKHKYYFVKDGKKYCASCLKRLPDGQVTATNQND